MYPVIPTTMTAGAAQVVVYLVTTLLLFCTFMLGPRP
jgi:hypothetical protein